MPCARVEQPIVPVRGRFTIKVSLFSWPTIEILTARGSSAEELIPIIVSLEHHSTIVLSLAFGWLPVKKNRAMGIVHFALHYPFSPGQGWGGV